MNHKVAVGSLNPVKIEAVRAAFNQVWPESSWAIEGYAVPSHVSSQPMSDAESIKGATYRAQGALAAGFADYGVGLEGGVQKIGRHWFDCGWIVVVNQQGITGLGSTARIITPPKMIAMLKSGKELGDVVDHFFNTHNSKQALGHFGLMTNCHISRQKGYADGVIMALVRFLHPELF